MTEPAGMCELKLDGGFKAGCYRLLLAEPDRSRSISLGPRKAQGCARDRRVANEAEPPDRGKILEVNSRRCDASPAQDYCEPRQTTLGCSHIADYDHWSYLGS